MSDLFGRNIELIAGSKTFSNDDFTIHFEVTFDDEDEANISEFKIYNLKDSTINEVKQGAPVALNAGYENDVGAIFLGEVKRKSAEWDRVDKILTMDVLDGSEKWLNTPIQKTYKAGITAKQILNDITSMAGLDIGAFNLPTNKVYPGGRSINDKLSNAIAAIAKDCGAKTHVNRGKIFIRPKGEGDTIGFVLDAEHGLISSPTPVTKEVDTGKKDAEGKEIKKTVNGWNIVSLLNHRITTDTLIEIQSKTANGVFRVESGKHFHDGEDFYTEVEVYPQ